MLEVLRSRSAPNRRGDGPPKWKHRNRGERWTEPLRLGLESESPRRRGIERPLKKLLGDHGVDELITGMTPPVGDIYGRGLSDVMRFVMCPPLSNVVSTRRGARGIPRGWQSARRTELSHSTEIVRVGSSQLQLGRV